MLPRVKTCAPEVRQLHVDDVLFVPKDEQQFGDKENGFRQRTVYAVISAACAGNSDGGYVDGAFRRTDAGEQQGSMTRVFLQFLRIFTACGARGTICSYFVAMRCAGDNQESAGEIKFVPFGSRNSPERTNSRGNQSQGAPHWEIAVMPLKVQHNLAEFPGVKRGGSVALSVWNANDAGSSSVASRAALAGGDGIGAYRPHISRPAASAQFPGLPQRFDGTHNVLGGNVCHGLAAEDRTEIFSHPRIMKKR